ncbi:MAG: hypothetical protein O2840_03390 [bacterium]|nr:hypothetical protein [bacterium]
MKETTLVTESVIAEAIAQIKAGSCWVAVGPEDEGAGFESAVDLSFKLGRLGKLGIPFCRDAAPEHILHKISESKSTGGSVLVIALDINGLKNFNDTRDHDTADKFMSALYHEKIAALLLLALDYFFCWQPQDGGDEVYIALGLTSGADLEEHKNIIDNAMRVAYNKGSGVMRAGFGIAGTTLSRSRSTNFTGLFTRLKNEAESCLSTQKAERTNALHAESMRNLLSLSDKRDARLVAARIGERENGLRIEAKKLEQLLMAAFDAGRRSVQVPQE